MFDGKAPALKRGELEKRQAKRDSAQKELVSHHGIMMTSTLRRGPRGPESPLTKARMARQRNLRARRYRLLSNESVFTLIYIV